MAQPTFEMNGKGYSTDEETLDLLRKIVPSAKEAVDFSAVTAIMALGLKTGRIKEHAEALVDASARCGHSVGAMSRRK